MKLRPTTDAEKIGRILEEKEMPIKEMVTLWTDVFPTLVIWSTEEIRQHLTELFEFNEDEADTLIEKYKTKLQNEIPPFKEMTTLPSLEKINPDLHPVIHTSWESHQHLKKATQALKDSEVARYFYESNLNGPKNFYKTASQKDVIDEKLQEIEKLMVQRLQNLLVIEEEAA